MSLEQANSAAAEASRWEGLSPKRGRRWGAGIASGHCSSLITAGVLRDECPDFALFLCSGSGLKKETIRGSLFSVLAVLIGPPFLKPQMGFLCSGTAAYA